MGDLPRYDEGSEAGGSSGPLAEADHGNAIIDKDRRLIEAALGTDKRVISLDDQVRKHLRDPHSQLAEIRSICWVNPCTPQEQVLAWLEAGAAADRPRLLGYAPPRSEK